MFVFPEKFNGLSLPLQEARAAGMLVLATDRFPMNTWLPREMKAGCVRCGSQSLRLGDIGEGERCFCNSCNHMMKAEHLGSKTSTLIPVESYNRTCVSPRCLEFDEAVLFPRKIAERIDSLYGKDISAYSESGREWAKTMSWEVLGPRYKEELSR